jgi:hypothetical protein
MYMLYGPRAAAIDIDGDHKTIDNIDQASCLPFTLTDQRHVGVKRATRRAKPRSPKVRGKAKIPPGRS